MPVLLPISALGNVSIDVFLRYVLPKARLCADETARNEIRRAITTICRRALLWREHQPAIITEETTTFYAYTPAPGQKVFKLLSATLDGEDCEIVDPKLGQLRDDARETSAYIYGRFAAFELRPQQAGGKEVVTYCAMVPSIDATEVPAAFEEYAEQIGTGALAKLLAVKDESYSDQKMAASLQREWNNDVATIASAAFRGHSRSRPRTTPQWF